LCIVLVFFFFFSSRRRHTRCLSDWSSDVCSSDLITGLSSLRPELSGKRLDLLKEIVPKLARVAVLGTSSTPGNAQSLKETELARSEEHTSELQSLRHLVCRLLLEKKKQKIQIQIM